MNTFCDENMTEGYLERTSRNSDQRNWFEKRCPYGQLSSQTTKGNKVNPATSVDDTEYDDDLLHICLICDAF